MKRRILFVTFELPPEIPGGIASVARDKIRQFAAEGFSLTVIGPSARFLLSRADLPGAFLPIPPRGHSAKFVVQLLWACFSALLKRPAFVYSMSGTYSGMVALIVSRILRVPYFVMAHGNEFLRFEKNLRTKRLIRRVFTRASGIMAVSNFTANEVRRIYRVPTSSLHVVYNGVSEDSFQPAPPQEVIALRARLGVPKDARLLLTVSRIDERKNHLGMFHALASLLESGGDRTSVRYLIGGRGPFLPRLEASCRELGLTDVVQLLGFVETEDLSVLYSAADLLVQPSLYLPEVGSVEGFGLVYVEAGLCATPSLGGSAGGAADAIVDGKTGYVVDGRDHDQLVRILRDLIEDPERFACMGRAARDHYLATYTLTRVVQRELEIVKNALGAHRAS